LQPGPLADRLVRHFAHDERRLGVRDRLACLEAAIVFDLFDVVVKYGCEVVDRYAWIAPTSCATP
jgi:hypothetical protein